MKKAGFRNAETGRILAAEASDCFGKIDEALLDLPDFLLAAEHRLDAIPVELVDGQQLQEGKSMLVLPGLLVGTGRGEGIEDVTHRHDPRRQRDGVASKPLRIAA